MTRLSDDQLRHRLRVALPVVDHATDADLWPQVCRRIERGAPPPAPADWALAIAVVVLCAIEPAAVNWLLFHL